MMQSLGYAATVTNIPTNLVCDEIPIFPVVVEQLPASSMVFLTAEASIQGIPLVEVTVAFFFFCM